MRASRRSGLLLGAVDLSLFLGTAAFGAPAPPIREVWQRPVGNAQSLAISPDGSRCALVTWRGEVICWTGGRLSWRRVLPGAEEVLLGSDGRAVAYTPLDALRRDLLVLDARGRTTARITIGGPISAVALSPDGRAAAIGTAGGRVEIHPLDSHTAVSRIFLRGPVQQLGYDPSGGLIAATVRPAWLVFLTSSGKVRWQHPAPPGCEFRIGAPPRGRGAAALTVAAIVAAYPPDAPEQRSDPDTGEDSPGAGADPDRIEMVAFSVTGKPVWRQRLHGRDPHLRLMAGAGEVVVAYERADRRGLVLRYSRTLACFAGDGSPRWQHGDMIYAPLLVSASPRGDAILSLCTGHRFWLLSNRGQTLWSYTARAPIRMASASADGTAVALVTSDGSLSLLKISPSGRG